MNVQDAPRHSFFNRASRAVANDLAVLHIKRDLQTPVVLRDEDENNEGYAEGKVTNTRFGSFPHSTLLGVAWGSQVRASSVDTGSRGRKGPSKKKRKIDHGLPEETQNLETEVKAATDAASGFVHILPPTPENWTTSLPHRTQVVYTHDSSYILQRLRVRPGSIFIEAGAGSGSFTHAAARAVHGHGGKVLSFEFHSQRHQKLKQELDEHGLQEVVNLRHEDVCQNGFPTDSIKATAVFLDLPAPWLALRHLTREGPLERNSAVRICTFSPCIEQVQRTVSELRDCAWLDVEAVEIAGKRIEVRRDRIGLNEEGVRGGIATAASVDEAVTKLRDVEQRHQKADVERERLTKQDRLANIKEQQSNRKLHEEGVLTHRSELELKTHTSYLVFATLPMNWTEEDEAGARSMAIETVNKGKSKKQMKRDRAEASAA
ncbi:tRNA (adenine-N(1)-)-methyltransferase catalytic subunit trm61 [Thelotrema lepadinum]|nr:tRNA (adenine-N(1)-)-methyltransferase catalytic subunit trm61 [Thelotrema lepadinum]